MTRDEAMAWMINAASKAVAMDWRATHDFVEAKAALAVPVQGPLHVYPVAEASSHQTDGGECDCGLTVVDGRIHVHQQRQTPPAEARGAVAALGQPCSREEKSTSETPPRKPPSLLGDPQEVGLGRSYDPGACLCKTECPIHGQRAAWICRHQAQDSSHDCLELAVLCETHGGHDACAVEIMRLQARIAEPVDVTTFVNEGRRLERDEIARAFWRKSQDEEDPGPFGLRKLAEMIRDGSIREWLPKEGGVSVTILCNGCGHLQHAPGMCIGITAGKCDCQVGYPQQQAPMMTWPGYPTDYRPLIERGMVALEKIAGHLEQIEMTLRGLGGKP